MTKLLTIKEVADMLQMSVRNVRRLPILFSRMGKARRYDARDVEAYRRDTLQCPSSSEPARRSIIRKSSSEAVGLLKVTCSTAELPALRAVITRACAGKQALEHGQNGPERIEERLQRVPTRITNTEP